MSDVSYVDIVYQSCGQFLSAFPLTFCSGLSDEKPKVE